MNVPVISVLTATFLVVLVSGCGSPETAWQDAKEANTVAAYQGYVEAHGDAPQAGEAEGRIRALQATELWEETREVATIDAYEGFLKQFPDSKEAERARTRLPELERKNQWASLRTSTNVDALRAFEERYRDHPVGVEAQQRLAKLQKVEAGLQQARRQEELQRRNAVKASEASDALEASRTHRVQLAARRTQEQARAGARGLEKRFGDVLEDVDLEIQQSGRFYLIRTRPLTKPEARSLCNRLQDQNQECLVTSR